MMRIIRMRSDAFFEVVQSSPDGGEFFPVNFSGLLRKMLQPIDLPAASFDERPAFRVGHRVEIFRKPEHVSCGHESLLGWPGEVLFCIADHSRAGGIRQADKKLLESRRGRWTVTFMPSDCGDGITHSAGVFSRLFLLQVEILVAVVLTFGYAKETCLYGLLSSRIGSSDRFHPLHFVG